MEMSLPHFLAGSFSKYADLDHEGAIEEQQKLKSTNKILGKEYANKREHIRKNIRNVPEMYCESTGKALKCTRKTFRIL